jgi:integrase
MTKRRARGEGSVCLRKDGRCIGEYDGTNGKRQCVSGRTLAEVRAKLRKALADREEGIAHGVSENPTGSVYLGKWLDSIPATVREYTYERNEKPTRLHIVPVLGDAKLHRLNALQVQAFYRAKLDEGLSNGTARDLRLVLPSSLKQAIEWTLIKSNDCTSVTPPKPHPARNQTAIQKFRLRYSLTLLWKTCCTRSTFSP